MTLTLRPEIAHLIDEQIKQGRFSTRQEVVEAAIVELCLPGEDESDLDDDTINAINEGGDQAERGEGIPLEVFREQWRERMGGK